VVIREGSVDDAIRASCAIPGVFPPSESDGRWLADGALANPVPVDVARDLGARFVIAINSLFVDRCQAERFSRECAAGGVSLADSPIALSGNAAVAAREQEVEQLGMRIPPRSPRALRWPAVLGQAARILQCRIATARLREAPPHVAINIAVGDVGIFDFHRAADLIECGREAATAALPEIRRALTSVVARRRTSHGVWQPTDSSRRSRRPSSGVRRSRTAPLSCATTRR
jgi:NTE family protein